MVKTLKKTGDDNRKKVSKASESRFHTMKKISKCKNLRNAKNATQKQKRKIKNKINISEKSKYKENLPKNFNKEQSNNPIGISKLKPLIDNKEKIKNKKNKKYKNNISKSIDKLFLEGNKKKENSEIYKKENLNNSMKSDYSALDQKEGKYAQKKEVDNQLKNKELKNDITFDLEFSNDYNIIMNNKEAWCKHLEIDRSINYDCFILLFENFKALNSLNKNNFELLADIIIKLGNLIKNTNECIDIYKGSIEKVLIYKKWNIKLFGGYSEDVWKRRENISNYKKRNNEKIEKCFKNQWKIILDFIGWGKELEFENIYNYFWFVWFLPNKLLIIWIAKLNSMSFGDNWWIKLLMEWEEYWIEILRSGGIKNWLKNFIEENKIQKRDD